MLEVDVNRIIPVTAARADIANLVNEVMKGNLYVLTRAGKPAAVIAPVAMAESIINKKNLPATTSETKVQPVPVKPQQTSSMEIRPAIDTRPLPVAEQTESSQDSSAAEEPTIDMAKVNQALEELETNSYQ